MCVKKRSRCAVDIYEGELFRQLLVIALLAHSKHAPVGKQAGGAAFAANRRSSPAIDQAALASACDDAVAASGDDSASASEWCDCNSAAAARACACACFVGRS